MNNQEWIVISGSARATPVMIKYAQNVVQRAFQNGWFIVVGDNPDGIDRAVLVHCLRIQVPQYSVVHLAKEPARSYSGQRVRSIGRYEDYAHRDEVMVSVAADRVMCIWNGSSKGTIEVFRRSVEMGIHTYLADFTQGVALVTEENKNTP